MLIPNDVYRFLQAVYPDYKTFAIFANAVEGPRTRVLEQLSPLRDCYLSVGRFGLLATSNLRRDVLGVQALVIDDVGTKGPEAGKVRLFLGTPTAIVRTSNGNHQWWYRLTVPVPAEQWDGFFAGVEQLLGVKLEGSGRQHLFRIPMGINTKPARNNAPVELVELNPEVELDPATIPQVTVTARATASGKSVGVEALAALLALIPNTFDREEWVRIGHWAKGLCPEGCEPFAVWTLTWKGTPSNPDTFTREYVEHAWEGFGSGGLLSQGGQLRALAEKIAPDSFRLWDAQQAFNDGTELPPDNPGSNSRPAPHLLASNIFVEGFVSPDYLVNKLITKAFLYSLTGQTGAGKTSITLRLAATVARGSSFGGLGTKPCRVLYLAAENPVDIQMRWIALADEMGFDVNNISVFFVKGWFKIGASMQALRAEALRVGGDFGLVIVDTGPVFFEGEDENDRVAMRKHARMMRELIEVIPGKPAVIVNVHPTKNAGADNLLPSGGGSFLNEVDGNFTAAKSEDQTIELGWQGKWRGVEFAPLHFVLRTVTHPRLVNSDGEAMPTVVCEHLSTAAREGMEQTGFADQEKMLAEMVRNPRISQSQLAVYMGWYFADGEPDKSKVKRYVKKLEQQKLVKKHLQLWVVSGGGKSKMNGSGVGSVRSGPDRSGPIDANEY